MTPSRFGKPHSPGQQAQNAEVAQRCWNDHESPSLGTIEASDIDGREDEHEERSRLPSHRAPTFDGIDPEGTGQGRTLCRHVATTLFEAIVVELPDLRQDVPLPFVKVSKRIHSFSKQATIWEGKKYPKCRQFAINIMKPCIRNRDTCLSQNDFVSCLKNCLTILSC